MNGKRILPVFFDPHNRRWPRLRRGAFITSLVLSTLFGVLIISILLTPGLKKLDLPPARFLPEGGYPVPPTPKPILTARERALRDAKRKLELERRIRRRKTPVVHPIPDKVTSQPLIFGFFVNWDDSSMSSLKEKIDRLDILVPEWLHLIDASNKLVEDNPTRQQEVTDFVRNRRPDLRIMPLVNNFNGKEWEGSTLAKILEHPEARVRVIDQLYRYVHDHTYAGVSIDFENIPDPAQPALGQFLEELAAIFHPAGLEISINVPANNDSFDYRRLADSTDYLILMAYDQHYAANDPGPVSALDWYTDILRLRQTDVPPAKTVIAIGNYAYDWQPKAEPAVKSFEEAVLTASESQVDIHLDPASLNPTFDYEDENAHLHHVWILDAVTAFNQVAVGRAFSPRGFALWRLGSEDPSLWNFLGKRSDLDEGVARQLSNINYDYNLDYEGRGEILRITGQPQPGRRELTFDPQRKLITAERYTNYPLPYVITRYGEVNRKLALTFDDGPDPDYTPLILDKLRESKVPATFFIVGLSGEKHPELLQRMIAEGHEIGNHTFTHPNISNISDTQLRLELAATQRLLESVTGRWSYLFRPPFAEDAEPDTPDQVRPLEIVGELGYVTVGMQINPEDWKRPGVEQIVQQTVEQAESGKGNVILLHDAGSDRTQTIQALPKMIAELQQHGFQFVRVSELLGKSHDEVMPPVPSNAWWQVWAERLSFGVIDFLTAAIDWLFLMGIMLGIARLVFIGTLAIIEHWRGRHTVYHPGYAPTVAVIVPAFNEEKVIVQTVTALLECEHPQEFEIIVVDDGSSDATYPRTSEAFADEPRVRVFTKPNEGKPAALNYGVARTNAEIIIALDADTIFARDTISKLVRHFADSRIGAVAGNAKVGNRINLLTRWQALEYITSQNLDRRAFHVLNCITVVPGAVGAWRRELVLSVGGFTHLTLAEDADLTMEIRRRGYSIAYEDEAIGLTEAPDNVRAFVRQRYRWMYGTLQAAWKHVDALLRPRYGSFGFVALPNIFIFQVFFPLISPVMDLLMIGTLASTAFDRWQHPDTFSTDSLWHVLFYYALFTAVDFLASALAFLLEPTENRRLIVWLFWQRFFYRQLMYYVAIKSTLASLRGISVGWNKLERKATVRIGKGPPNKVPQP